MPSIYVTRCRGSWDKRNGFRLLAKWPNTYYFLPTCSNNFSNEAKVIREEYEEFSNNEGAVSWQGGMCGIDWETNQLDDSLPLKYYHTVSQ